MKFRKKPVVIEALKWTGSNIQELSEWAAAAHYERGGAVPTKRLGIALPLDLVSRGDGEFDLVIKTLEGEMKANYGDWVICGIGGEFYPCRPDIFEATYDATTIGWP